MFSESFRTELKDSPHHYGEVAFLESVLRKGMNAIDVGGNVGVTAVAIGKAVGQHGRVYVFEPVSEFYDVLEENIKNNDMRNMTAYNIGLGNTRGRVDFFKHGEGSGVTHAEDAERMEVDTDFLDGFLRENNIRDRIDVINMDCEGSELNVLRGGIDLLEKDHPTVFGEVHPGYLEQINQSIDDIVLFFKDLNYQARPVRVENLDSETAYEECSHIYAWFE